MLYNSNMSDGTRSARPWDIFNDEIPNVDDETFRNRISICLGCEHYLHSIHVCGICKCLMKVKCRLGNASCPIDKW